MSAHTHAKLGQRLNAVRRLPGPDVNSASGGLLACLRMKWDRSQPLWWLRNLTAWPICRSPCGGSENLTAKDTGASARRKSRAV